MLNVDQVYLAHYLPLVDRKNSILKQIQFPIKWITDEPLDQCWTTDKESWEKKVIPYSPYRQLTKSEISIAYKHIKIYKDIVEYNYKTSLIFEDDIIIENNFVSMFNMFLEKTPDDWDLIFIGSGCNLRVNPQYIIPGQIAYKIDHPASKCIDSYCIKYEAAKKILSTTLPFSLPYDFELNYQMKIHNMNIYWWEPPLVRQGSMCGIYPSTIEKK